MSLEELTKSLILPSHMSSASMSNSPGTPNPVSWAGAQRDQPPFPGLDFNRNHHDQIQAQDPSQSHDVGLETSSSSNENNEIPQNTTTNFEREPRGRDAGTPKNEDRLAELRARLLSQKQRSSTPLRPKRPEEQNGLSIQGGGARSIPSRFDGGTQPEAGGSSDKVGGRKITAKAPTVNEPVQSTIESKPLPTDRRASSADIESLVAEHRPVSPAVAPTAKGEVISNLTQAARGSYNHGVNGNEIGHTQSGLSSDHRSTEGSEQGEIRNSDEQETSKVENPAAMARQPIIRRSTGSDPKKKHEQPLRSPNRQSASATDAKQPVETKRRETPQGSRGSSISMTLPELMDRSSINSNGTSKPLSFEKGQKIMEARYSIQNDQQLDVPDRCRLTQYQSSPLSPRAAQGNALSQSAQQADLDRQRSLSTGIREGSYVMESAAKVNTDQIFANGQALQRAVSSKGPANAQKSQAGGFDIEQTSQMTSLNTEDVVDWLEISDFHDVAYRDRLLKRFRRKRDLERERLALEEEERQEWEERLRIGRTASVSAMHMPPPPPPSKESKEDVGFQIKDMAKSSPAPSPTSIRPESATFAKRQHAEMDFESGASQPVLKAPRLNNSSQGEVKAPLISPTASKPESIEDRSRRDSIQAADYRRRSRSPNEFWNRRSRSPPSRPVHADHPTNDKYGFRARDPSPDGRYRRFRSPEPYHRSDFDGPVRYERPLEDRIQDPRPPSNNHRGNNRGRGGYANFGYKNGLGAKPKKSLNLSANGQ